MKFRCKDLKIYFLSISQKINFEIIFWSAIATLLILKYYFITNFHGNEFFLQSYKFMAPDSFDWLANGIHLFKLDTISFRNPGLPLIIKALFSSNLLYILPLINQIIFGIIMFYCYFIVRNIFKSRISAYIVVLFIFLNYSCQNFANYVLSDFYAIAFITMSLYYLFSKKFYLSLFFLGISALFQNFAFFLTPFWGIYILVHDLKIKADLEKLQFKMIVQKLLNYLPKYFLFVLVFFNFNLFWSVYKFIKFGNPFFTRVEQFELLNIHFDKLPYYLINIVSLFGPVVVLLFFYFDWNLGKFKKDRKFLLLFSCLIFTFVFWSILYDWEDRRFLLYLIPFFYPLLGLFFTKIRKFKFLLILAGILIYPTTILLPSFFTANLVPITNWHYFSINKKGDDSGYEVSIKKESANFLSIINPSYAQFLHNRLYYKFDSDTQYTYYGNLISDYFDEGSREICLRDIPFDFYLLNTNFLIRKGLTTGEINIRNKNCGKDF